MLTQLLGKTNDAVVPTLPQISDVIGWKQMLDHVQVNVILADRDFNIQYVNPKTVEVLSEIESTIKDTFGVSVADVVGGSIHRFHKDPARIEKILQNPQALPHEAEFTFGDVTLSAFINGIYDKNNELYGYLVNWENVTERNAREKKVSQLVSMLESLPLNVIFADKELVVQYMNPASTRTLKKIQHLLPVPVDSIVGTCIDTFHKAPEHQRRILSDPNNLPLQTNIQIGEETLDLLVSAIYDQDNNYIGAMATWDIITEQVRTKEEAKQTGQMVASTATELSASINEISASVSQVASMSTQAENFSKQTAESINELKDASEHIGNVVDMIRELADQTNLLALNATIEAARAGESGRSFAVVAGEVKELAKGTTEATQSISDRVTSIQKCIHEVVGSSTEIAQAISEVSMNTSTIAAAIEEQSVTMQDLSKSAENLTRISE